MTREILRNKMLEAYLNLSCAKQYIVGCEYNGIIYYSIMNERQFSYLVNLEKDGTRGWTLKVKLNNAKREFILSCGAQVLCSANHFQNEYENCKYNRGEVFERLVNEHFGFAWKKDNTPFWVDGDITLNGVKYQIKYEKATLAHESVLLP